MNVGDVIFLSEGGMFNFVDDGYKTVFVSAGVIAFVLAIDNNKESKLTLIVTDRLAEFNCPQEYMEDFWRVV